MRCICFRFLQHFMHFAAKLANHHYTSAAVTLKATLNVVHIISDALTTATQDDAATIP